MTSSYHTTPETENSSTFAPSHKRIDSYTTLNTQKTDAGASPTSILYEPPWDKQCVLSLDGGGIRGFSSLIILRELMKEVHRIETQNLSQECIQRHSSYYPEEHIPCTNNDSVAHTASAEPVNRSNQQAEKGSTEPAECGKFCRYLPCHYFDYIGGTSTGGLIAIMLGRLRMSVQDCVKEYEKLAGDIFGHPRWASVRGPLPWLRDKYDGKTIQRAVEDVIIRRMSKAEREVGAGNFNSPRGLCRTAVFAYASKISNEVSEYDSKSKEKRTVADNEDAAPYIFRSYDHWGANPRLINERNPGVAHGIPIWEAARATTAAPFYFDPIKISNRKFGDGGFGTNNPAEEMFNEVSGMNGSDAKSIALLLSIGTGKIPISRFEKGLLRKYLGYINAARRLASDSEAPHQRLEGHKQIWDLPYFRFNVPEGLGLDKIKLDEWITPGRFRKCQESTLGKIARVTEKYCEQEEVRKQLKKVAEILVNHRKEREKSDLWGMVSRGVQYRCTYKKCHRSQELRPRREDLEIHLRVEHKVKDNDLQKWLKQGICPPLKPN